MQQTTKGLRCQGCSHEQNVAVSEAVLGLVCPKCGAWVKLGEALGLSFGQAAIAALVVLWLLG
jgi:ribosomal protein S27E